jgi:hypothetical protein
MAVDLVTFLRARLDEDEQVAHDALLGYPASMHASAGQPALPLPTPTTPGAEWRAEYQNVRRTDGFRRVAEATQASAEVAEHIARHDPARVLAEVAAKRAVVELHGAVEPGKWRTVAACAQCGDARTYESYMVEWPCPTLRALAQVYADHSDYDEAVTWNDHIAPRP